MARAVGICCLGAVPGLIWLGVIGARHTEMNYWKHPILLGPFARLRWGIAIGSLAVGLALVGVSLVLD